MKNIHPLRTERRRAKRASDPPALRCIFCVEEEHAAGRHHDPFLTCPEVCQKHQDELTEARRNADVSMVFERDPIKRIALALKATSVFLHKLADSMWLWGTRLEDEANHIR